MGETNFYSYLYSQPTTVAFDEIAEVVELSNPQSVQRAFEAYLADNNPPLDIKEELLEEKFFSSPDEGRNGNETHIRYDMTIPGLTEEVNKDELQTYFEEFLERIGAENDSENGYGVEIDTVDNERSGVDLNIYMYIRGKQVKPHKE